MKIRHLRSSAIGLATALSSIALSGAAEATNTPPSCPITHAQLRAALVAVDAADSTGFDNHYWGVVVNQEGVVCAVAYSGQTSRSQWLASRQIAAAKAFTANGLSLDVGAAGTSALSTAQLYAFVQPSNYNNNLANPLYGLAGGNVLDSGAAYNGQFSLFGTASDPMVGSRVGGTITFGGGLALYFGNTRIGGLGVSGDTACADHSVAWQIRAGLGLEPPGAPDKLTFATDPSNPTSGHPHCPNDANTKGAN